MCAAHAARTSRTVLPSSDVYSRPRFLRALCVHNQVVVIQTSGEGALARARGRERFNPAYRVHYLLSRAHEQPGDMPALEAWSNTFGVTGADVLDETFDTLQMLRLMSRQIALARKQMTIVEGVSEKDYAFAFDSAANTINVSALGTAWQDFDKHITANVLRTLRWCSQQTPTDPKRVADAELADLEEELEEFRLGVEEHASNDELRLFLLEHIAIIEKAFLEYRVVGVQAFQRASGQFVTSLQDPDNQAIFEKNKEVPEVKKLASIWKRTLQAGQVMSMANTAITVGRTLLELGGS